MKSPFHDIYLVKNFPDNYPGYKKIIANIECAFSNLVFSIRKSLLNNKDKKKVLRKLKRGDIVLVGDLKRGFSLVVKGQLFTHTSVYIGDKKVVWATGKGVETANINEVFRFYDTLAILRIPKKVRNRKNIISKVVHFLGKQVGKPFNFEFNKRKNTYFCSQLINEAYKKAGYNTGLVSIHKPTKRIKGINRILHAYDFFQKGNFEVIFLSHNLKQKRGQIKLIDEDELKNKKTGKKLKTIDEKSIFVDKEYLDWWSIVHFSFGVLFAIFVIFVEMTFLQAMITIFILATAYEVAEPIFLEMNNYMFCETKANQVLDVVIAMIGTAIGFKLGNYYLLIGLFVLCWVILGSVGFFKNALKLIKLPF